MTNMEFAQVLNIIRPLAQWTIMVDGTFTWWDQIQTQPTEQEIADAYGNL